MSSPDFDHITNDVFQPHVERWYELDLDECYPYIEPDSALGKMGVAVHQRLREVAKTRDLMGDYYGDEARETMDRACNLAEARVTVYAGMYADIAGVLTMACVSYEAAVAGALNRGLNELDKIDVPEKNKLGLERLTREFTTFLDLEDGQHFQEVA